MKNAQIGQDGIRELEQVAANATGDEVPTRKQRRDAGEVQIESATSAASI